MNANIKMSQGLVRFLWIVSALLFGCPNTHFAAAVIRADAGAAPTDIQDTISLFQTDLGGVNNGAGGGPFASGFRAINWDGVPDTSASPNSLATNFFNSSSMRGAVFATPGSGLQVSADLDNPSMTPVRFGNIDPAYPSTFQAFSTERLFSAVGSPIVNISFFVPGMPTMPAYVAGFGAVFSDVDFGDSAFIEYFDENANTLTTVFVPAATNGLSFLGVFFNAGERVARVRITSGNAPLGPGITDEGTTDLVAMDDFIYAEPQMVPEASTFALLGLGACMLLAVRRRRQRNRR